MDSHESRPGFTARPSFTDIPGGTAPWMLPTGSSRNAGPPPPPASMIPVPSARLVRLISVPHNFQKPVKRIAGPTQMEKFLDSETLSHILGFVVSLSDSVRGKRLSDDCIVSVSAQILISLLEKMSGWIDDIPPKTTAVRYGNPSYRDWSDKLEEEGPDLVDEILPQNLKDAIIEVYPYFADSFGNWTRIDYGTGHEANFVAFLYCLTSLGIFQAEDFQAIVTRVFVSYLSLMRKLQTTYWMEPAGSHGVWGLDDYHFLPFIFGSSQLVGHKYMKPRSILNEDILSTFAKDYLYLQCVQFIKKVKKGPLSEHSPMINDISAVPSWQKVNSGMLKMYRAELWSKVPIMQHFLFGSILPWPESEQDPFAESAL